MITKTEILNLTPGEVLVMTVDTSNLPPQRSQELLDYVSDTNELAIMARQQGNFVVVNSSRVTVEKLSYNPEDKIVVYVDVGNMPPAKAREYLEHVRENMAHTFEPNQTLILAKGNKIAVSQTVTLDFPNEQLA